MQERQNGTELSESVLTAELLYHQWLLSVLSVGMNYRSGKVLLLSKSFQKKLKG